MAFDVAAARKEGYSDAEIADYLAKARGYDVAGARKEGHTDGEIIAHLSSGAPTEKPKPGLLEKVGSAAAGLGEAALSTVTGATTGLIAGALGGANQIGKDIVGLATQGRAYTPAQGVREAAAEAASGLTYAPRTETGQEIMGAVGDIAQAMAPMAGLSGPAAAIGASARPSAAMAVAAAKPAVTQATKALQEGATAAVAAAKERLPAAVGGQTKPTAGTMGSVGAAATDKAAQRQALADSLSDPNDPMQLTKGMATRDNQQLRFEREEAKNELGAPLRERVNKLNAQVGNVFERWLDETGATELNAREAGIVVDKALKGRASADKARVREAFNEANKSPEANAVVNVDKQFTIGQGEDAITASPISYINAKPGGLKTTALLDHARQYAKKIGIAEEVDGELVPMPATVRQMEAWRKEIGAATGYEPTDIRDSTILKKLIDAQTDEVAGPLYKRARDLHSRYATLYKDRAIISKLLNTKRGTSDRQVALEDTFGHLVGGSLDDLKFARQVLQSGGENGKQAWREIRGQAVQHLRERAGLTGRTVSRNERGDPIVSPDGLNKAVRALDSDGKLDVIFGKIGAQKVRDMNDLVIDIQTTPPGVVNTSNNAGMIAAAIDMMLSGSTGVPLPVASAVRYTAKKMRDRAKSQRILDALEPIK